MFILKVKKKNQHFTEINISDKTYWIGRNNKNDIVLDATHGISRKHLKIFKEDSTWKIQCVSKLGGLTAQGNEIQQAEFHPGDIFYLGDYSFHLENSSIDSSIEKIESTDSNKDKQNELPKEESGPKDIWPEELSSLLKEENKEDLDLTKVTHIADDLQPYIIISLSENEEDQSIHLKGNKWTIGRDPSNDICIEDTDISRKHFVITKKQDQFFIQDLNSSNCTYLDDQWLDPKKEYPLESGQTIRILDIEIYFEIRNPRVKKQLNFVPALKTPSEVPLTPPSTALPPPPSSVPTPYTPPSNVIVDETILTTPPPPSSSKKKKIFAIVLGFVLIAGVLFFLDKPENSKKEDSAPLSLNDPFDALSEEDKEHVKDIYSLAQQLYYQKKYELCYEKLNSLHEIIPFYEQSESLIVTCKNGADSIRTQIEIEQKNKQIEEAQKILLKNVEECKRQFASFTTLEELERCLAPAIEIDPEYFEISSLILDFETNQMLKKERQSQIKARKKRIEQEMKIYQSAKNLKDQAKPLEAIEAYKAFIKRNHPKEIKDIVETAKRELALIEEELHSKIQTAMQSCTELMDSKQYKQAHKACMDVLNIFPKHQEAVQLAQQAISSLNRTLKPLYEESVLNESLGQIEIAKKHWQKILEQDIPNGNYYTKAQHKLKKY